MNRKWYQILIWLAVVLAFAGTFVYAYIKDHQTPAGAETPGNTHAQHTVTTQPESSSTAGTTAPVSSADATQPETSTAPSTTLDEVQTQLAEEYKAYMALSAEAQQEYFMTFASYVEFMQWFDAAKAAYEESLDRIEIEGDGNLDIGDIIEGND